MRPNIIRFFGIIIFLILTLPAQALLVPERPSKGEFVADTINIIKETDETKIKNLAVKLYDERKIPIVVVTIDSLLSYTDGEYLGIEDYSKKYSITGRLDMPHIIMAFYYLFLRMIELPEFNSVMVGVFSTINKLKKLWMILFYHFLKTVSTLKGLKLA